MSTSRRCIVLQSVAACCGMLQRIISTNLQSIESDLTCKSHGDAVRCNVMQHIILSHLNPKQIPSPLNFELRSNTQSHSIPNAIFSKQHSISTKGWWRPIECLIFVGHFPQKSRIISGSFAKNELQLQVFSRSGNRSQLKGGKRVTNSGAPISNLSSDTGGWRPIGCLIYIGFFPQKSPRISGSFVKKISTSGVLWVFATR